MREYPSLMAAADGECDCRIGLAIADATLAFVVHRPSSRTRPHVFFFT